MWFVTALGRFFRTTAIKLALLYFLVFSGLAIFLVIYISDSTDGLLSRQLDQSINDELATLVEQFSTKGVRGLVANVEMRSRRPSAGLYLVTDFVGRTIVGNIADLPLELLAEADGTPVRMTYRRLEDGNAKGEYHAVVEVFRLPGGFRLAVGRDTTEREQFREAINGAFEVTFIVVFLLGVVSWLFVSRYVLRRIDGISATSQKIMNGDLSERLEVTGSGDEFDRLALSLNAMLGRIEQLMTGLKEVSDNIAHDLKTPLTRMRGRLEAALRQFSHEEAYQTAIGATLEDTQNLIDTFDSLLRIARLEAGSSGDEGTPVDASLVMEDIAELYAPVLEDLGATLITTIEPGLYLRATRTLLTQAIANLVDNAIKYGLNDEGSTVQLSASGDGSHVILSVADSGPGIPEADRPRALARFGRLEASRTKPGSGLGLALVSAVAHLLGGEVTLGDAQPGLIVKLTVPRIAKPDSDVQT